MKLSIRSRLYGGFIMLFSFLLASYLVAVGMLYQLDARMNGLVKQDVKKMHMAGIVDQSVLEITRLEHNIILSDSPDEMAHFAEEITLSHGRLQGALNLLYNLDINNQEMTILQQVTADTKDLIAIDREVQRLGMLNSNVLAERLSENEGRQAMILAEQALEKLLHHMSGRWVQSNALDELRQQIKLIGIIKEMQRLLMAIQKDEVSMILATVDAHMDQDAREMERNEKLLSQLYDSLLQMLSQEDDQRTLAEFDRYRVSYMDISRQIRTLTRENGNHKAVQLSRKQGWPILARLREASHTLAASSERLMNEAIQQSDRNFFIVFSVLSVVLCLSFAVGGTIALRISRDINRGLDRAMQTVNAVACGDLGSPVATNAHHTDDEFDRLMHSMGQLMTTERHVVDAVKMLSVGNLEISLHARSEHDELIYSLKFLVEAMRDAANIAERLAIGDLKVTILPRSPQDQLMHSLSCLVEAENRVAEIAQRLAQDDLSVAVVERSQHDRLLNAMKHLAMALQERNEMRRMLLVTEKMSNIGQFAVRVAHEINNPLTTAVLGLQNVRHLMPPQVLVGSLAHRMAQVERNMERATHVAQRILEYSWTGQPECDFFDLREELQEVLELVQANARPVPIFLEIPESLRMWGDRSMISQLFRNLIQNAMDATPDNGMVLVRARCVNDGLIAEIKDDGKGISPEVAGKICDPFFTTKKSGVGVGLGLPICYSIVQQYGGTLTLVNNPDRGVLATLRLPITHRSVGVIENEPET